MAKPCALISTSEPDTKIVELLLGEDNSLGPMGSGGYEINRDKKQPREATCLTFKELDCAPASSYPAFIKDGKIWATHIKKFVLETLSDAGIRFTHEKVETPAFIIKHLKKSA
jgi:hypothetical protein